MIIQFMNPGCLSKFSTTINRLQLPGGVYSCYVSTVFQTLKFWALPKSFFKTEDRIVPSLGFLFWEFWVRLFWRWLWILIDCIRLDYFLTFSGKSHHCNSWQGSLAFLISVSRKGIGSARLQLFSFIIIWWPWCYNRGSEDRMIWIRRPKQSYACWCCAL